MNEKTFKSNQKIGRGLGGVKTYGERSFGSKPSFNKNGKKPFDKNKKFSKPFKKEAPKILTELVSIAGSVYSTKSNPHVTATAGVTRVLQILGEFGCHLVGAPQHILYSYVDPNTNNPVTKEKITVYYTVTADKKDACNKKIRWALSNLKEMHSIEETTKENK